MTRVSIDDEGTYLPAVIITEEPQQAIRNQ
jgi:hypothetical protein